MSLFLLDKKWINDQTITLPAEESHHLITVLRKKSGDTLRCRDTAGNIILAHITDANPNATLALIREVTSDNEDIHPVTMVIPLLKAQRSEWIVQKITELGCDTIIPYFFERSVVRPNKEKHAGRLQKIAREACKQCERSTPPLIHDEVTRFEVLTSLLNSGGLGLRLLPWENATTPLNMVIESKHEEANSRIILAIGPEGGVSLAEADRFSLAGFTPVTLGNNILRSETAAISSLANVVYACRDAWNHPTQTNGSEGML